GDATDRAAADLAVLDELVHHMTREVARYRETDALISAGLAEDSRVDADQFAARVDERAPGVPRIDRRVGVDEVLVGGEAALQRASGGAHDPERHALIQLEGVA